MEPGNPFDQFDGHQSGNVFDAFDSKPLGTEGPAPAPTAPVIQAVKPLPDNLDNGPMGYAKAFFGGIGDALEPKSIASGHYENNLNSALVESSKIQQEAIADAAGQIPDTNFRYDPKFDTVRPASTKESREADRQARMAQVALDIKDAQEGIKRNYVSDPNFGQGLLKGTEGFAKVIIPSAATTAVAGPLAGAAVGAGIMANQGYNNQLAQSLQEQAQNLERRSAGYKALTGQLSDYVQPENNPAFNYSAGQKIDLTNPEQMRQVMSNQDFVNQRQMDAYKVGAVDFGSGLAFGLLPGLSGAVAKNALGSGASNLVKTVVPHLAETGTVVGIGAGQQVANNAITGKPLGENVGHSIGDMLALYYLNKGAVASGEAINKSIEAYNKSRQPNTYNPATDPNYGPSSQPAPEVVAPAAVIPEPVKAAVAPVAPEPVAQAVVPPVAEQPVVQAKPALPEGWVEPRPNAFDYYDQGIDAYRQAANEWESKYQNTHEMNGQPKPELKVPAPAVEQPAQIAPEPVKAVEAPEPITAQAPKPVEVQPPTVEAPKAAEPVSPEKAKPIKPAEPEVPQGVQDARATLSKLEASGNGESKQADAKRVYIRSWELSKGLEPSVPEPAKKPISVKPILETAQPTEPVKPVEVAKPVEPKELVTAEDYKAYSIADDQKSYESKIAAYNKLVAEGKGDTQIAKNFKNAAESFRQAVEKDKLRDASEFLPKEEPKPKSIDEQIDEQRKISNQAQVELYDGVKSEKLSKEDFKRLSMKAYIEANKLAHLEGEKAKLTGESKPKQTNIEPAPSEQPIEPKATEVKQTVEDAKPSAKEADKATAAVINEVERLVEVGDAKNAKQVMDRVQQTLTSLEADAKQSAGFDVVEAKAKGGKNDGFEVFIDGKSIGEIDKSGKFTPTADGIDEKGKPVYETKPRVKPQHIDGVYHASPASARDSIVIKIASELSKGSEGYKKYVVRIPGDGTFKIDANPMAIRKLMKNIKSEGPSLWRNIAGVKAEEPAKPETKQTGNDVKLNVGAGIISVGLNAASSLSTMDAIGLASVIAGSSDRVLKGANPIVANLHLMAEDTGSGAVRDVANMFGNRGSNAPEGAKETYDSERTANLRIFKGKLVNAFEPFAKLSNEQIRAKGERLAAALSGEIKLTGPDAEVVKRLKVMADEIHAYAKEAGVDIGYAEDYGMPHSLDVGKVMGDEAGFLEAATKAYEENNPLRIKKLTDKLNKLDQEFRDKGRLSADKTKEYDQIKAERDALVTADPAKQAEEYLNGVSFGNEGGDMNNGIILESGPRGTNTANFTKERIFEPAARKHLREYYNNDVRSAWEGYINRMTRIAEFARRFGHNGSKWTEMVNQMKKDGLTNKQITDVKNMALDSVGALTPRPTPNHALANSLLGLSNMAKLKTTAGTIFLESQSNALSGNISDAVTAPVHMAGQFLANMAELTPHQRELFKKYLGVEINTETGSMELARICGMIDAVGVHDVMENSAYNIDAGAEVRGDTLTEKASRGISRASSKLGRSYGLENAETSKRVTATRYATDRLAGHTDEFLNDNMLARAYAKSNPDGINPFTVKNEARMRLRNAGISDENAVEFSTWYQEAVKSGNFNERIADPKDPMAALARKAIRMEAGRATVNVGRTNKIGGQINPFISQDTFFGKAAMSFLNYPAAFREQVYKPFAGDVRTAYKGYTSEGSNATYFSQWERSRMMARVLALPAMAASAATWLAFKVWALGDDAQKKKNDEQNPIVTAQQGATYTGALGGKAEFISRIQKGQFFSGLDEAVRLSKDFNMVDNARNTKERAIAKESIRSIGVPALEAASATYLPLPLAAAVNQVLASPQFREAATDFTAGKKQYYGGRSLMPPTPKPPAPPHPPVPGEY